MKQEAFVQIVEFISPYVQNTPVTYAADTQLCKDLGICGYKGEQLLYAFITHFNIENKSLELFSKVEPEEVFNEVVEFSMQKEKKNCLWLTLGDLERVLLDNMKK